MRFGLLNRLLMSFRPWANQKTQDAFGIVPRFVVDQAADLYWIHNDKEVWDTLADFTGCAPPFSEFWIEFSVPHLSNSRVYGIIRNPSAGFRVGVLVHARDYPDTIVMENCSGPIRWLLELSFFFDTPESLIVQTGRAVQLGFLQVPLLVSGAVGLLRNEYGQPIFMGAAGDDFTAADAEEEAKRTMVSWLDPILMALMLINCKNVVIRETGKTSAKAIQRKDGGPRLTYHVLDILPLTTKSERANGGDARPSSRPLHVCRGHFADYRERGLFGKYFGIFYVGPHLRGSADRGQIVKDYQLANRRVVA